MKRSCLSAVALIVVGTLLPGSQPARAAETVVIHAGYLDEANPKPYEYTRYYPAGSDGQSIVKIHRGTVVQWEFDGFHSVTFLPGDEEAGHPSWLRADDLPGSIAFDERWWRAIACGKGAAEPCVIADTASFVSSGLPLFDETPFRARIDLPPGTYRYHCTIHPDMHGRLQVVPDSTAVPTQADLDAQTAREIAADTAAADALVEKTVAGQRIEDGTRVWTVKVGSATSDNGVQVYGYLGGNPDGHGGPLKISRGETVEFVSVGDEPHTVTFPREAVGGFTPVGGARYGLGGFGFLPACDPDDPARGIPGIQFPPAAGIGCPAGSLEVTVQPWMVGAHGATAGDAVATPATYLDSGLMYSAEGAEFMRAMPAGSGDYMPSSFTASFPAPGTFSYSCNIHFWLMSGSIEVS